MNADEMLFFHAAPHMLPVYETLRDKLVQSHQEMRIKVSKTQISFNNRHLFAAVSLPHRRIKGVPERCMLVSFGLSYRLDAPRIFQAVEPYPNRWTHHVPVRHKDEIDDQLMAWLDDAFHFAMVK